MRRPKWDKRSELAVKYCCQDPFTGQNRNSKCGSGIEHKRLGGWRPKILYLPVLRRP